MAQFRSLSERKAVIGREFKEGEAGVAQRRDPESHDLERRPGVPGTRGFRGLGWSELLHINKERGSLAPGLAADIVAMPANPMEDIESLRKINFVMKDGKIIRRP